MEKRKFYNTGDAKGFTKQKFFETVLAVANGEDVDEDMVDLMGQAAEYELEGIAARASTRASGEKKDALQSDYACALRAAIVPLIGKEPKTAKELIDMASAKGLNSPKGTPWAAPWVSRVLNAEAGVQAVKIVVDTVDGKGLKVQKEATAYQKA